MQKASCYQLHVFKVRVNVLTSLEFSRVVMQPPVDHDGRNIAVKHFVEDDISYESFRHHGSVQYGIDSDQALRLAVGSVLYASSTPIFSFG